MSKIALISDLHFGKLSRTREFATIGENIQDETEGGTSLKTSLIALLQKNAVTHLFIAGDLSSTGSPHEFICCQSQIHDIVQSSGINIDNVFWSVGNHDIDWRITKLHGDFPPEISPALAHSELGNYYQLIAANTPNHCMNSITLPENPGVAPFSGIVERDSMIVFILNSGWCSSHNQRFPHGKLTTSQLNWFRSSIKNYSNDSRWKIALLHHHPFNLPFPFPGLDISTLEEGSEFVAACGEYGINLVCHGHRHHPRVMTMKQTGWRNPVTFLCAGSLSVNSEHRHFGAIPNVFHIIEIANENRDIFLNNYEYTTTEGWIPIVSNCAETPLDAEMFLGSIYLPEDITASFFTLIDASKQNQKLPMWRDLPKPLRTLTLIQLNSKLRDVLSPNYIVYGKYPEDVFIIRKNQ
jgi:3',5'-cyclic AMP phosphodiesterase CpdA